MNAELIPHSRATTSWELLEDVIRVIQEEPRRILMNDWKVDQETMDEDYSLSESTKDRITRFPACGTVGCISGWMGLMTAKDPEQAFVTPSFTGRLMPRELLTDLDSLFYGEAPYPFPPTEVEHGSPEYVQWVVNNIRKFMHQWALQLQSYSLEGRTQ